ncbi:T9SS type B sorting domain-containing protein [Flavobacterium noncentrifugens]|uniref:T9SS type B sorting domain-containing protein n=1 Tax=Flavobacterium noncentrifugens TaxID=1128970 RepID=UPI00111458DD|nr:T9SS type B sorting domain-containing protein [Flavobacterium noncentrifugens]
MHPADRNVFLKRAKLLFLLFYAAFAQAQFSLSVTKTDETCSANGTLTMATQNANPGAAITYTVYREPGANPIAVLSVGFLDHLAGGTYRILATQSNNSTSATQTITIDKRITPLAYTISGTNITCGNLGTMTVDVFSGTGAFYEVISGPVTIPRQTSPTFTGLPAGVYQVRVTDICGQGWVMTYTLFTVAPLIQITPASFPVEELPTCSSIIVSNTLYPKASTALTYPLHLLYEIFPIGGGSPVAINRILTSGDPAQNDVQTEIPFAYDQIYSYRLTVTDNCTNFFFRNSVVNQKIKITLTGTTAACGNYFLTAAASNYKGPYQLNFLNAPIGFTAPAATTNYTTPTVAFGDNTHPVPFGNYTIEIKDACGHTETASVVLIPPNRAPAVALVRYPGCMSNKSKATITADGRIVSAWLSVSPTYSLATPLNISSFINANGILVMPSLPEGRYKLTITDECGKTFPVVFDVPGLETKVDIYQTATCEIGKGSLRIKGQSTPLLSVKLTAAPAAYTGAAINDDMSRFINTTDPTIFSLNNLPPGNYRFDVVNSCNVLHQKSITVDGYNVTANTYNIVQYCGSFDLTFLNTDNLTSKSYFLQKFNPSTNTWGHPETNVAYPEGTVPTALNSYILTSTTPNIGYNGNFRIIKYFTSYESGDIGLLHTCIETIQTFTFNGALEIQGVDKTTCNGLFSDVTVSAVGIAPLTYEIVLKNGLPFSVPNGTNPLFTNLDAGVYRFKVNDGCGSFSTRDVDVGLLPSILSTIHMPGNIVRCENPDNTSKADFNLISQNPDILGLLNPLVYNITYHNSPGDATTDINPLPDNFTSESTTIYARVEYNNRSDCYGIVAFDLIVNEMTELQMSQTFYICPNDSVTLHADKGYAHYLWSTGAIDVTEITISSSGLYTLLVTEIQNGVSCNTLFNIDVILSEIATVKSVEISDWTDDQNWITVAIDQPDTGNYSYSLDNINFQSSNVFTGLKPGNYRVYIKDLNGCPSETFEVSILNYPRFFTPNNDGYNDLWKIENIEAEPQLEASLFDRYGKLLKVLHANDAGWDGKLNGHDLPSDDYWFVVTRENGKIFKGHFAMKR